MGNEEGGGWIDRWEEVECNKCKGSLKWRNAEMVIHFIYKVIDKESVTSIGIISVSSHYAEFLYAEYPLCRKKIVSLHRMLTIPNSA